MDTRVSVYKKTDETYQLKLKASRMFYSEVTHKYGSMPFNLRNFEDEKKAKLGVTECVNPVSYTHLDVYKRQLLLQPS